MRRLLFWALLPFVLPQAIRVRRNAPRFQGAVGATTGSVGDGPALRLLAIGDSVVAGVGASTMDRALTATTAAHLASALGRQVVWYAHGKIGAGVHKLRAQVLPEVMLDLPAGNQQFDAIFVSVGVNDITGLVRSARWLCELQCLLDMLRSHFPDATIALSGMPPLQTFPLLPFPLKSIFGLRGRTFSAMARKAINARDNMVFVPLEFAPSADAFSDDGFHPSEASYMEFGDIIASALSARMRIADSRDTAFAT